MQNPKRLYHIPVLFGILLLILIGRLAHIQLIDPLSFSKNKVNLVEESVKQRIHSVALDDGRGKMLDRHGELLEDLHVPAIILFPFLQNEEEILRKIAQVLNMPAQGLKDQLTMSKTPLVLKQDISKTMVSAINEMEVPGVYGQLLNPDEDMSFAFHFIGAVRENPKQVLERYPDRLEKGLVSKTTKVGINGIQQAFDPFLLSEGESKLIYHVQQSGKPLFGLDVKYTAPSNPFYPVSLLTTLDRNAQQIVEAAVDQFGITKGGAVLLDIETSDVLGLVSRPLPPKKNPQADGTGNHMLLPQIPGSVFKLVTAAAAIDQNHVTADRTFDCSQNTYDDGDEKRNLGMLSFEDSFFQSCNYTFATLLNELMDTDRSILEHYAHSLGMVDRVGWEDDVFHLNAFKHFPQERRNVIWNDETDKSVSRAIAQTAIGQLNVRLSPLSVANMMATIARGGAKKQVRAAHAVLYKNDTTLVEFKEKELKGDSLSPYTVRKLQDLLEGVVHNPKGTGYQSFHDLPWKVAGKSGTAEKGQTKTYNKWFAGYFPAEEAKYALVVVDLDAKEFDTATNKAFAEIVRQLYNRQQPAESRNSMN
ncbi:penicillin-binding transpeptidase domain-containing protein [Pseudalkalibacillus sp. SCS-8]|uniref:penicillin-binding transpeptidase domain-containing protein n=1 Tax=Pseudalkalibacillus nanhaiensis TaxID=3115291 RepID=UPI0032DB8979